MVEKIYMEGIIAKIVSRKFHFFFWTDISFSISHLQEFAWAGVFGGILGHFDFGISEHGIRPGHLSNLDLR